MCILYIYMYIYICIIYMYIYILYTILLIYFTYVNIIVAKVIPNIFKDTILISPCNPIQPRFYYYWWRAISATYILRPNIYTKIWLSKHRKSIPFHDHEKYISVYIRKG